MINTTGILFSRERIRVWQLSFVCINMLSIRSMNFSLGLHFFSSLYFFLISESDLSYKWSIPSTLDLTWSTFLIQTNLSFCVFIPPVHVAQRPCCTGSSTNRPGLWKDFCSCVLSTEKWENPAVLESVKTP